jgi:hypothetical protein
MNAEFEQWQPFEFDTLIDRILHYCHTRHPEALDRIFDALPQDDEILSQQLLVETVAQLQADVDTLGWFCGYMASEINCCEDSDRPQLPMTELSKKLIKAGMQAFVDFVPYPGQRLVIVNPEKFAALPVPLLAGLRDAFDLMEQSGEQLQQVNEALRQEFRVPSGGDRPAIIDY